MQFESRWWKCLVTVWLPHKWSSLHSRLIPGQVHGFRLEQNWYNRICCLWMKEGCNSSLCFAISVEMLVIAKMYALPNRGRISLTDTERGIGGRCMWFQTCGAREVMCGNCVGFSPGLLSEMFGIGEWPWKLAMWSQTIGFGMHYDARKRKLQLPQRSLWYPRRGGQ